MNGTHVQLLAAARAGDVAGVQAALDKCVPVDARDQVSACTSSKGKEGPGVGDKGGTKKRVEWYQGCGA